MSNLVSQISHICLSTCDLKGVIDFYVTILRGEIVHKFLNDEQQMYGCCIKMGQQGFIEVFKQKESIVSDATSAFRHLCFEVENIKALSRLLAENGFPNEVYRGRTDNVLQCWTTGPDGVKIEFHEYDSECFGYGKQIFLAKNN